MAGNDWSLDSPEGRVRILENACNSGTLSALISPIVASSFGVIPILRSAGKVTLATFPHANPDGLSLLEEVLDAELIPTPFEEGLMGHFLHKIYLKDGKGVNFPTFEEPDFLKRENLDALTREKKETIRGRCHLPPDRLVLCDISFRSVLQNLDRPEGQPVYDLGDASPAFRRTASRVYVDSSIDLTDETVLLLRESYSYRGVEFRNGFRGAAVKTLPHVIHPSELQIAGIGSGAEITFHIYDHLETIEPGEARTWKIGYHFLSFGNRYHREISLRLHSHRSWPREAVSPLKSEPPLRPADLRRWFGYDWEEDGTKSVASSARSP